MMGVMEVRGQIHRRCIALVSRGWKSSVSEHGLEVEVFGNQERRCGGVLKAILVGRREFEKPRSHH
jgi:hypothetical protein